MAITYHAGRRIQGLSTDNSTTTSLSLTGLKAYYKFNEASGNIINQASSIGSSEMIANSDLVVSGATYGATGKIGTALSFDGSNDDAKASASTVADWNFFATSGNSFTVSCWMKTLNFTGSRRFLATGNGNAGDVIFLCDHQNDGTLDIAVGKIGTDNFTHSTTDGWTDSAFHFVCLQYDDSTGVFTSTIDGNTAETSGSHNLTNTGTSETYLYVGQNTAGQDYWNGVMDELSIWNRVLTSDEISAIYNAGTGIILDNAKSSFVSKPTNVQLGSRFEETDTRKMYHIEGDEYKVHSFTSSGTLDVTGSGDVEYLVVAGGGGGGYFGAGGGAGGLLTATGFAVTAQSYSVTVGSGGAGSAVAANDASTGSDSIFSTITSDGGGGASSQSSGSALPGGSGGGSQNWSGTGTGGSATAGQGFAGGSKTDGSGGHSGGGGASEVGEDGSGSNGHPGGDGLASSISGSSVYYSGGGGGGTIGATPGIGGLGGGGSATTTTGNNGDINTGGGGGGGSNNGAANWSGGNGGSGIVIIKYSTSSGITATGGTITTTGGWVEEGT